MPDWNKIKAEYIAGTSYRKLAEKYEVSPSSVQRHMRNENWADLRRKANAKRDAKIVESVASQRARSVCKIDSAVDTLIDKIEEGIASGLYIQDSQSVRQIVSSIKELREMKGIKSDLDTQEQMARIDKLRKESSTDTEDNSIRIVLGDELKELAK